MNNTILAIDLGKYKSVACVLDQGTGEFCFATFDTSRAELQKLIAKERPGVVVIEWVGRRGAESHLRVVRRARVAAQAARRGFWGAKAQRASDGTTPSLRGNSQWPDPV